MSCSTPRNAGNFDVRHGGAALVKVGAGAHGRGGGRLPRRAWFDLQTHAEHCAHAPRAKAHATWRPPKPDTSPEQPTRACPSASAPSSPLPSTAIPPPPTSVTPTPHLLPFPPRPCFRPPVGTSPKSPCPRLSRDRRPASALAPPEITSGQPENRMGTAPMHLCVFRGIERRGSELPMARPTFEVRPRAPKKIVRARKNIVRAMGRPRPK